MWRIVSFGYVSVVLGLSFGGDRVVLGWGAWSLEVLIYEFDSLGSVYGSLNVSSKISNVKVYIDGEYRGTTPNIFTEILVGNRKLVFERDDYLKKEVIVEIEEGRISELEVDLEIDHWGGRSSYEGKSASTTGSSSSNEYSEVKSAVNFIDLLYSPKDLVGLRYSYCARFGVYIGFQIGEFDYFSGGVKKFKCTFGPVFRLGKCLYLSIGAGAGYEKLLEQTNAYYERASLVVNPSLEYEINLLFKIKKVGLTVGYGNGSLGWFGLESNWKYGYIIFGLGLAL